MATTTPSPRGANRSLARTCRRGAILLLLSASAAMHAETSAPPTVELRLQNHLFEPSEIHIPAHTKVRLLIHNLDSTPEEFASWDLNRKKIIFGNHSATVLIGPLAPGTYRFFGEFNPKTALGRLVVR
jgi:hypothetical protein